MTIQWADIKFPPINLHSVPRLAVVTAVATLAGCGAISNTPEDVQIQQAYYDAVGKQNNSFSIECDGDCKGLKMNIPLGTNNMAHLARPKTSAEVSGALAEKFTSPLTTFIQMGGVWGLVKTVATNAGTGNTSTTNVVSGANNTTSATPTATNSTQAYNAPYTSSTDSNDNNSVDNSAVATPTVVDQPTPTIVKPEVVNPVVVDPVIVK